MVQLDQKRGTGPKAFDSPTKAIGSAGAMRVSVAGKKIV